LFSGPLYVIDVSSEIGTGEANLSCGIVVPFVIRALSCGSGNEIVTGLDSCTGEANLFCGSGNEIVMPVDSWTGASFSASSYSTRKSASMFSLVRVWKKLGELAWSCPSIGVAGCISIEGSCSREIAPIDLVPAVLKDRTDRVRDFDRMEAS